jgi:putative flavoprotein involved in K+ transport
LTLADQPNEELDVAAAGVSTVIWCTGYTGNFSWIKHDVLDQRGVPRHENSVGTISGLYFVGFPWLSNRVGDPVRRRPTTLLDSLD